MKGSVTRNRLLFPRTIGSYAAGAGLLLAWMQPVRLLMFLGGSMSPTYPNYSLALTLPATGELHRGDIVVIKNVLGTIVKRVIYVPGDKILQVKIENRYVDVDPGVQPRRLPSNVYRYATVPSDMIYVLGDHRAGSIDSRTFGFVSMSEVDRIIMHPRASCDPDGWKTSCEP